MNKIKKLFANQPVLFYVELGVSFIYLGNIIYYSIQSNIDKCFNSYYLLAFSLGFVSFLLYLFIKQEWLVVLSSVLYSAAFGLIMYNLLPTLSDVWNHVNFIGGNLTAYMIYASITLVSVLFSIAMAFIGDRKKVVPTN